jgi:hypothetical protein
MYCISDPDIEYILLDIKKRGVQLESLQQDLVDHICIIIEQSLEETGDFKKCYDNAIKTFYKDSLSEIEQETVFLLTHKGPFVLLNRNQFFLLLFTAFIGPFIGYDGFWMVNSGHSSMFAIPYEVWGASVVYSLFPLLIILVLFFTPEGLDPLIPRKSKILFGLKPFIKIIAPSRRMEGSAFNSEALAT